jgi:hypothetical protein
MNTEAGNGERSVAIMQPYFFPYIGYYQLLRKVDHFVFYDDVNYINRGWINRNRVLVNAAPSYFTVELSGASQNKLIMEVPWIDNSAKLLRTLRMAYAKAPHVQAVCALVEDCFLRSGPSIADLAANSVMLVAAHLGLPTTFARSSEHYPDTRGMERAQRLITITQRTGATTYINPSGGRELYTRPQFAEGGISLHFMQEHIEPYAQFGSEFVPALSIIDVLMFNDPEQVLRMLDTATLDPQ